MSKAKAGTAHAANQDGIRRPQHEVGNASPEDVSEMVHDTLVLLGEELYGNGSVEATNLVKLLDMDSVDRVVVEVVEIVWKKEDDD